MGRELPTYSATDREDERAENVHLMESDDDYKVTAEDRGDFWLMVDWEAMDIAGHDYWFDRSAYSIPKDYVARLALLSVEVEQ